MVRFDEQTDEQRSTDFAHVQDVLGRSGFRIKDLNDLVRLTDDLPGAVPVIAPLVMEDLHFHVLDGIVRALTVKQAAGAPARLLLERYIAIGPHDLESREGSLQWAIANALSVAADASVHPLLVEVVTNRAFGRTREMFALALARTKEPSAADVLIELLKDPDVSGHAVMALGRLKAVQARRPIEPFLEDDRAWVRRQARQALAKIDKAAQSEARG